MVSRSEAQAAYDIIRTLAQVERGYKTPEEMDRLLKAGRTVRLWEAQQAGEKEIYAETEESARRVLEARTGGTMQVYSAQQEAARMLQAPEVVQVSSKELQEVESEIESVKEAIVFLKSYLGQGQDEATNAEITRMKNQLAILRSQQANLLTMPEKGLAPTPPLPTEASVRREEYMRAMAERREQVVGPTMLIEEPMKVALPAADFFEKPLPREIMPARIEAIGIPGANMRPLASPAVQAEVAALIKPKVVIRKGYARQYAHPLLRFL